MQEPAQVSGSQPSEKEEQGIFEKTKEIKKKRNILGCWERMSKDQTVLNLDRASRNPFATDQQCATEAQLAATYNALFVSQDFLGTHPVLDHDGLANDTRFMRSPPSWVWILYLALLSSMSELRSGVNEKICARSFLSLHLSVVLPRIWDYIFAAIPSPSSSSRARAVCNQVGMYGPRVVAPSNSSRGYGLQH